MLSLCNKTSQYQNIIEKKGRFLGGGRKLLQRGGDFSFSGFCSETKRVFDKSSNAQGVLLLPRKVDAAHYEWSITYHYQLPQRSSTLDKLYRVFHRYSARLKVSFAPQPGYSFIGTRVFAGS